MGFLICLVSGCQAVSPSQMMKPPAIEDTQAELMRVVKESIPQGAQLTMPVLTEQKDVLFSVNLDQDGQNEIVAFYERKATSSYEGASNGMIVMKKTGDAWKKVSEHEGKGDELERVIFQDMTGDGLPEIAVGWSNGEGMNKELTVFTPQEQKITLLWQHSYTAMGIGEITGDSLADVAIVLHDRENMTAEGKVFAYQQNQMKETDTLSLDGSVNGFSQVLIGKATPDQQGLFIDAQTGAHSAVTDLFVRKNGKLVNVLVDADGQTTAFKAYALDCKDVNSDGIIEIGFLTQPLGSEDLAMSEIPWISTWNQWKPNNEWQVVQENYTNYLLGIDFTIPQKWLNHYTVEVKSETKLEQIQFSYTGLAKNKRAVLFTLKAVKKKGEQKHNTNPNEWILGENNDRVLIVKMPEEPTGLSAEEMKQYRSLLLDPEMIRQSFKIFSM